MLEGRTALITGGSSGIGAAVAVRLAAAGADVAVVASSDRNKAKIVSDEICATGGCAEAFAADLRDRANVQRLVNEVSERFTAPTILVASAGIFLPTPIGEPDTEIFDRTIDINLKAVFYCINAVVPEMRSSGGGSIVAISSVAGTIGVGGHSGYCASKAAVSMMVRALAIELGPHNINVNAVAPGNTETPMNAPLRTEPEFAGFRQALEAKTPSTRVFSDPSDVAEMVYFLVSPAGRAMHGSTVLMDEGISAGI